MSYTYDISLRDRRVFVEARHAEAAARILSDAMFEMETDEKGNIEDFYFDGDWMPDDEELCKALAPFLRGGSFLEFLNEVGETWRWVFDGQACERVYALALWPAPGAPRDLSRQIQTAFAQYLAE